MTKTGTACQKAALTLLGFFINETYGKNVTRVDSGLDANGLDL